MKFSTKRLLIVKANTQVTVMIAVATAITMFSLVASRALLNQQAYQGRVIDRKTKSLNQLKSNVAAVSKLQAAYLEFQNSAKNTIGGDSVGTKDRDGDNTKIILDALPSKYDFPALTSSIEKIFALVPTTKLESITGSDDELNQLKTPASPSLSSVAIPFQISYSGSYLAIQSLLATLQSSIRPMQVNSIEFSGRDSAMKVKITAQTYYQPEKVRSLKTEVIK